MQGMRQTMGAHGSALIGIDLQKSADILEAAYNDVAGVTAEFTLNLLVVRDGGRTAVPFRRRRSDAGGIQPQVYRRGFRCAGQPGRASSGAAVAR